MLPNEPLHLPNEPPPLQDERLPEESLYDDPVLLDNLAGAGELVVPVVPHQLQDTLTRAGGHKEKGYFFLTLVVFSFVNVHCTQGWAYILFKRTQRSFTFFIKERKRTLRSFWFYKSYKNDRISQKKNIKERCVLF